MDELPQIETAADIEMSGPVRDDLAARVMVVVVISLVVAMAVVFSWFNRRLLIPDARNWERGLLVTRTFDPPTNKVELFHNQGDGQFFAHMAQDPFLSRPDRIRGGTSEQAYRLQRPMFGWLGWAASGGDAGRAAWSIIFVTVASVGLLAGAVAMAAARMGRSPLWGLAVLAAPGVHVDLLRSGPEVLGAALVTAALVVMAPAWRSAPWGVDRSRLSDSRLWVAVVLFALAGLTRESFLVVPFVLAGVWLWQSRSRTAPDESSEDHAIGIWRSWAWPLASVVPFLIWVVVLRIAVGAWPVGAGPEFTGERMASFPLGGLVDGIGDWRRGEVVSFLLVSIPAGLGLLRSRSPELRALILVHVALAATFGQIVWVTWVGFGRVLLPLSVISLLAILDRREADGADRGIKEASRPMRAAWLKRGEASA